MEDDLKIVKVEYLSNHFLDPDFWVLRGKLEGNSEEISSVALLSPACLYFLNDLILEKSQINTKAFIIQDLHNTTTHCLD